MTPAITYSLVDTKEGCKTLVASHENRQFPLHSMFYPTRESEHYREKFIPEKFDFLIVLGIGLGYHLIDLANHIEDYARILLIDIMDGIREDIARNEFTSFLTMSPKVEFILAATPGHIEDRLAVMLDLEGVKGIAIIEHEASVRIFSDYYDGIKKIIDRVINKKAQDRATRAAFSLRYVTNTLKNLELIRDAVPVKILFGRFDAYPCMIITSGPGLDRSIGLLRKNAGRFFIIAADSALPALAGNGIEPDFIVSIDPQPSVAEHTAGISTGAVRIFSLSSYPEPDGFIRRAVGLNSHPLSQIVENLTNGGIGSVDSRTGTVAGDAVCLGIKLGFKAASLLGFDFSFPDHVIYARGTAYQRRFAALFQNRMNSVENQNMNYIRKSSRGFIHAGRRTRRSFVHYLESIERFVSGAHPRALYNIDGGGVPIAGVRNVTAEEFLKNECGNPLNKREIISRIMAPAEKAGDIIPKNSLKSILEDPKVFHESMSASFGREPDEKIQMKISRLIGNLFK